MGLSAMPVAIGNIDAKSWAEKLQSMWSASVRGAEFAPVR